MFDVFYFGAKPDRFAHEQPANSLEDAANKSRTGFYWYIYGGNDYTGFDFDFVPAPWESDHVHVFPSQWQRNGSVYLANKNTVHLKQWNFQTNSSVRRLEDQNKWIIPVNIDDTGFDYSWHPDEIEPDYEYHFPTQWQRQGGPIYRGTAGIKFVRGQKIKANSTQIFYMDFLNTESAVRFKDLQERYPDAKLTRYVDNHLNVFKRIVNLATTEFVWIVSSFCVYHDFDFTWHPAPEQREMIHVFPTYSLYGPAANQKRGDTFYIHVPSLRNQLYELELLDWFNVINYCTDQTVPVYPVPVINYNEDNLVNAVKETSFQFPYAIFKLFNSAPNIGFVPPCIWSQKDRAIEALNASGSAAIVPREARAEIKTQLYDYPYVIRTDKQRLFNSALDIVFISNGEPDEELMFHHTEYMTNSDVKWIRGVNGRTAAYQAAAQASTTPWFFAVFAKLEVVGNSFPWYDWQPDYWQEPKHYIFNARNPVNGLEYGHQGMIAYNKNLVLENNNPGIDFTLSQPHESVPLLSGVARFNQDPWMTWRTAFREVVKLKHFTATQPTIETEHRLNIWLTVAEGEHAEWCLRGARDAVDYYNEVSGEYDRLMLSFDWPWLNARFNQCNIV
jgi:hypothetical protein